MYGGCKPLQLLEWTGNTWLQTCSCLFERSKLAGCVTTRELDMVHVIADMPLIVWEEALCWLCEHVV